MYSSTSASASASWLSGICGPLAEKFGSNVTVSRTGNMVCWGYDGQSAVIEMTDDGLLRATFIDSEAINVVSASPAAAAYRTGCTYALNRVSSGRMVADLVDFFSGVREPKFQFIDAYPR
jgi:hypothetical protein